MVNKQFIYEEQYALNPEIKMLNPKWYFPTSNVVDDKCVNFKNITDRKLMKTVNK